MAKRILVAVLTTVLVSITQAAGVTAQGPREGIKVHGHWVIDIREADGTLVTHREFENALVGDGADTLAAFLSRRRTPGLWRIMLMGNQGLCRLASGVPDSCFIAETRDSFSDPPSPEAFFTTLTIRSVLGGFVLTGNAIAAFDGQVARVFTYVSTCGSAIAATECQQPGGDIFSGTELSVPTPVAAGQIIQVTVTFTFS